jgi:hypothetical protein
MSSFISKLQPARCRLLRVFYSGIYLRLSTALSVFEIGLYRCRILAKPRLAKCILLFYGQ